MDIKEFANDIFFNKIIKETSNGEVGVYEFIYDIGYNTTIRESKDKIKYIKNTNKYMPTLIINNIDEFKEIVGDISEFIKNNDIMFINKNNSILEDRIYSFFSMIFSNATYEDFDNPVCFLRKYLNFMKNDKFSDFNEEKTEPIESLDNFRLVIKKNQASSLLETPYCFNLHLEKEIDNEVVIYELPRVMYGIDNNKGYIYAIQNKKDVNDDERLKKLKRLMYKINSNVEETEEFKDYKDNKDDYYPENITDITLSNLISATAVLSLFKKNNIDNIYIPDFLPVRYFTKEEAINKRVKYMQDKLSVEELEIFRESIEKEHLRIQQNITEKFLRVFRRVEYHFDNINIVNYPDNGSFLMFENNDNYNCNNQILNEIYSNINIRDKTII